MRVRACVVLLGLLVVLLVPRDAAATDATAARLHFTNAAAAFTAERYAEAATEFVLAYEASGDPTLLFNVAQSYRLAGNATAALTHYRRYVSEKPGAADRATAERYIGELEQAARAPEPNVAMQPTWETPTTAARPADGAHPGRTKIIAGGVTLGVGVVLAATSVAFAVLARQAGDDLSAANRAMQAFDPSKQSAGKRDDILFGTFAGVGAAAAVAGAIVLGLGVRERRTRPLPIVPALGPHGGGATMRVAF